MALIQETFLELEWEDAITARQARDQRATELQSEGFVCTCENLYTVTGYRVFLLEASKPEPIETTPNSKEAPALRPRSGNRPSRTWEER